MLLAFALTWTLLGATTAWAIGPVNRAVLALYDSSVESNSTDTRIHRRLEMPLNYLGYAVTYFDIASALPDPDYAATFAGVVTWFSGPRPDQAAYIEWANAVAAEGTRFVVFEQTGMAYSPEQLPVLNSFLAHFGLEHSGWGVNVTYRASIDTMDDTVIGFERPLTGPLPPFEILTPVGSDSADALVMNSGREPPKAVLVTTGPGGGFVASQYAVYYEPITNREQWIINPFVFLERSLGTGIRPIPDVTTLSGRRIYFNQIDGNGWNYLTEVEGYAGEFPEIAPKVILEEAIKAYPDLPVSVGLTAGDLDSTIGGHPENVGVAREIFSQNQVEVASHTYTHPWVWQYYETYNREAELELVDRLPLNPSALLDWLPQLLRRMAGEEPPYIAHQRYISMDAALPRVYLQNPFTLQNEVNGALGFASALAPEGKVAQLYLWSGDTLPFEAALRQVRLAGVPNLNGGNSRFDKEYPSILYLPAIGREVGPERQIYAPIDNEDSYTAFWTANYYAFRSVEETIRNTGEPRRLKPFDLYYHMYSGQKDASLAAIREMLQMAEVGDYTPIEASLYARLASNFYDVAIQDLGDGRWLVSNRGDLQTVRFDAADAFDIDMARSAGVVGATHALGALYVSLDPAQPQAIVALRSADTAPATKTPYLVEGRWLLRNVKANGFGLTAEARGYGTGEMTFADLPPGHYQVSARREGDELYAASVTVEADGRLTIAVDADAQDWLTLAITRETN